MVAPNVLSVDHLIERPELIHLSMEMVKINVKEKIILRRRLPIGLGICESSIRDMLARETIIGLPPSVLGRYIRNGPNPQFIPRGPYHLFDGDGMLHSIKISKGKPTFCSRFIKTYKYTVERDTGSPVVMNNLAAYTSLPAAMARHAIAFGRGLSGQYDFRRGMGNANTSVAHVGGKLMALGESDLPYAIKLTSDGDIITLGRFEECGNPPEWITAHPKLDNETGEAFVYGYSVRRPFLTYFRINADGSKQAEVPIFSKKDASLVHDFAISKNYAIFPDSQVVIKLREIMRGKQPGVVDTAKVPRWDYIAMTPWMREMWWVEVPGFNFVHTVNAWEEDGGDTIVMVAPNVLSVDHLIERPELIHLSMEMVKINVKEKIVTRRPITHRSLEFAVINPGYVGKRNRYIYAAVVSSGIKMAGVVKLDLSLSTANSGDCVVASRLYEPGCYGGEPCFIPRDPHNPTAEEDDGYIVNYIYNETTNESKFIVMDAKSSNLEIVAVVKLPQRVPYGFHGMFVPDCHLQKL
ncbi:hypothetical protein DH2020_038577 [Rehmannia glutinosa]|uniref:Carotenoid cleavage dioxygenase n=1 Tax=Rehmannia glutinosa TaxID=99300 RepID=A0ABR0V0T0_REHGL